MKKICLLCLVLLPLVAFAQDAYKPFLKEGKRWNYELEHVNVWEDMHTTENVSFIIEGDMEIGGKTYKKMYYATSDETFATLENKTFYRALREEGRQVYMYDETLGDVLLFDFGMQPGESYVIGESSCLELTSSRQMTFHGRELTVMLYQLKEDAGSEFIVESVGCRNGWDILEEFTPVATDGIYDTKRFLSCYEDGGCIFTASDFQQITTDISQYETLLDEEKSWLMRSITSDQNQTEWLEQIELKDDVVIDGIPHKKLFSKSWIADGNIPVELEYRGAYIGQDSEGGIYYYSSTMETSTKVMDFSAKVGDVYTVNDIDFIVIAVSDTIMENTTDKKSRRCIYLGEKLGQETRFDGKTYGDIWIEGIGSVIYGLEGLYGAGQAGAFRNLVKCTQQQSVVYQYAESATVVTPTIQPSHPFGNNHQYDLLGRPDTPYDKGTIYIQNGKKYVRKNL